MNKLSMLAVLLAGCAQVFGVDDYGTAPADAGARSVGEANGLFNPRPPYLTSTPCRACLKASCGEESAACSADGACTRVLDDKRAQPEPLADYQRSYLPPADGQPWAHPHGAVRTSQVAAVMPLLDCIERNCAEACELGRDFSCTGSFDWPATEAGAKNIHVDLINDLGKRDWKLELCLSLGSCGEDTLHAETDVSGRAEFYVNSGALTLGFYGSISVTSRSPDPNSYPFVYILRPAPILAGMVISELLISRRLVDEPYTALGGPTIGPDRGAVWVVPSDCRGDKARHVKVDFLIASDAGSGFLPCTQCRGVIYVNDQSIPDALRDEVNSFDARAILSDLPLRYILVLVRDSASRRIISAQQMLVRGGSVSVLRTYPISRRELMGLPASVF